MHVGITKYFTPEDAMTTRRLAFLLLPLTALAAAALSGCSEVEDPWRGKPERPRVVVSFPPLASFARKVAGDHAGVVCLAVEQGVHHYQPRVTDAIVLQKADVLFANGLGLDDAFTEKVRINGAGPNLHYVKIGDRLLEQQQLHADDDPHIWLGVTKAKKMVQVISKELQEIDPDHAADYEKNTADYLKELDELLAYGRADEQLGSVKNRKLVSFHESLKYFAEDFSLDVVGYIEIQPDVAPTAAHLGKLVELCQKEKVHVIAVEPQYNAASADQLLAELKNRGVKDVTIVVVDPMETAEAKDLNGKDGADWYTKTMRKNIDELVKAYK
jgi:ABC-type Zn uptake system ZnuABC Zn-binding protein ZnuA